MSKPRLAASVCLGLAAFARVASAQTLPDNAKPQSLVVIPYAGVHAGGNSTYSQEGPGPRVGAMLGGHVLDAWSLNFQIGIDWLNDEGLMPSESASGMIVEATFSPLYHAASSHLQVIAGPKIGAWIARGSDRLRGDLGASSFSAKGSSIGVNVGLLGLVGRGIWAGVLASADVHDTISGCSTQSGFLSGCPQNGDAFAILGLTAALLY